MNHLGIIETVYPDEHGTGEETVVGTAVRWPRENELSVWMFVFLPGEIEALESKTGPAGPVKPLRCPVQTCRIFHGIANQKARKLVGQPVSRKRYSKPCECGHRFIRWTPH